MHPIDVDDVAKGLVLDFFWKSFEGQTLDLNSIKSKA